MTMWTRRDCAAAVAVAVGMGLATGLDSAVWAEDESRPRTCSLELKNLHTGEVLKVTFDRDAGPDPAALAKLQHLLRDYRVDEEHAMDPALYGLLCDLAQAAGYPARYEVISGYRSPGTNKKLHDAGHQVAEHSQHMEGHAIDVRLLGCDLEKFRDIALQAKRGGVGYYPASNFVHVDTGRVRTWTAR
jgi:uncharacterized protein YcbK (DUF882 family)